MDVTPRGGQPAADDASGATPALDVMPRAGEARGRRKSKLPAIAIGAVVLVAIVFVFTRAIGDAATFYLNADEAVAKEQTLGEKRFRLQGNVVPGSTERTADGVSFKVAFNGVEVPVTHVGDPPDLFQDCIPVVLEGRFEGAADSRVFSSNLMIVKHDSTYDASNPDRIKESSPEKCGGVARPATPTGASAPLSAPSGSS